MSLADDLERLDDNAREWKERDTKLARVLRNNFPAIVAALREQEAWEQASDDVRDDLAILRRKRDKEAQRDGR